MRVEYARNECGRLFVKKIQVSFFIDFLILCIFNLISYWTIFPITLKAGFHITPYISLAVFLLLTAIMFYFAAKLMNYSIVFVLLFWIFALLDQLKLVIFPIEVINIFFPVIWLLYGSWDIFGIPGNSFPSLSFKNADFGTISLTGASTLRAVISLIAIILSLAFTVRMVVHKIKTK